MAFIVLYSTYSFFLKRTETEELIYDAALEWCKRRGLLSHFPNVAQSVRFNLISIKHLLKSLRDDADVRSHPEVTNYLLDRMQSMAGSLHAAISRPRFSTQVLIAMPYRSKVFGCAFEPYRLCTILEPTFHFLARVKYFPYFLEFLYDHVLRRGSHRILDQAIS